MAVSRERWMAASFALGATCFLIGPFPGYYDLVGARAVAVTFFVGSIFFTVGGALQVWLAQPHRHTDHAAWWAAVVQSAGTLFFNATTYWAMHVALTSSSYDRLVWRPDALGSVCFLVSGAIAFRATPRAWEARVNLLGCVFFGISAVAGYVVPSDGSMLDVAAANWTTALGAACFLACAAGTLRTGHTTKSPRLRRLRRLEHAVERIV